MSGAELMRAWTSKPTYSGNVSSSGRGARHVKDFSVFDFNYVPGQPVMRAECTRLIDALLRFDVTGIPTHLAVIGSRGSGKTLTLRYLERLIPSQTGLHMLYANCRQQNTSFKIFAHLLGEERRRRQFEPTLRTLRVHLSAEDGRRAGRDRPYEPEGPTAGDSLPAQAVVKSRS